MAGAAVLDTLQQWKLVARTPQATSCSPGEHERIRLIEAIRSSVSWPGEMTAL